MSRGASARRAATFIVRLWTEHGAGQAPQWRGQVEHVQTGEQAYFRTLDHMLVFIVGRRGNVTEQRPADEAK